MNDKRNGVLVLDATGDTLFASGTGMDTAVQKALVGIWQARVSKPISPMFTLGDLSVPMTVLSHASGGTGCFLLYHSEHGDPLYEFISSVDFAPDILRHFVTNPYEAMTVVDEDAKIRYISPIHERFFGVSRGEVIGRPAAEVIENTRLTAVLQSGKAEIGHVQRMRGTSRVVNRTPIVDQSGHIVGAIGQVMFKSPNAVETLSQEIRRLRQGISFYERELPRLRGQAQGLDSIVGNSDAIHKLKKQIRKIASLNVSVLLVGESGVGKDLVAHAIHQSGERSQRDMVLINAAAIPPNLVEAELFGYEGGAFTGAEKRGRSGKFDQADQSSLFLDEIGDMPLEIQVKLLRTLQDGTFQRVGSNQQRRSDFRLISASNRDFRQMLAKGEFRLDLFYRISAVTIRVPPLRERLDDIPLLAQTFLDRFAERHQVHGKYFGEGVFAHLQSLPWPGNVRQLQHIVERAAIFSEHDEITIDDCEVLADTDTQTREHGDRPPKFGEILGTDKSGADIPYEGGSQNGPGTPDVPLHEISEPLDMHQAKTRVELDMIRNAMARFNGNKKKVAEYLGISRSHLYKRLEQLQV